MTTPPDAAALADEALPYAERLEYERRILSAECGTQRVLNDLRDWLGKCIRHAEYTPDVLDPKAAEILRNLKKHVEEIDVTDHSAATRPATTESDGLRDAFAAGFKAAERGLGFEGCDESADALDIEWNGYLAALAQPTPVEAAALERAAE